MRLRPPTVFSKTSVGLLLSLSVIAITFSFGVFPPASAVSFPINPGVAINTATGSQLFPAPFGGSCTYQNFFYGYWLDGSNNLWMSSSTDGVNWATPVNELLLTPLGTFTTSTQATITWKVSCTGNIVVVVWTSVNAGSTANTLINYMYYSVGTMSSGTVVFGVVANGPKTNAGTPQHNAEGIGAALTFGCVSYFQGQVFYCVQAQASAAFSLVSNNVVLANLSTAYTSTLPNLLFDGSAYMIYTPANCGYALSGDAITWPSSVTTIPGGDCTSSHLQITQGVGFGNFFYIPSDAANNFVVKISNGGTIVNLYQWFSGTFGAGSIEYVDSDGASNFVVYGCVASSIAAPNCKYAYTTNSWATFTSASSIGFSGAFFGGSTQGWSVESEAIFSQQLEAFGVETANQGSPFTVFETVFGIPTNQVSTGTQTIGSCTSAGGTFVMANQTLYMYQGTAIQSEVVNSIQVSISAVGGSTGTHTIQLVIYSTPAAGSISPSNLLTLNFAKQIALTSGTGAATITVQVSGLSLTAGAIWGVGIVGDNKVTLVTSSLGGLFTFSGVPVPTSPQNSFYTAQGATSATQIALCANGQYALIQTVTVTTTVTQAATTTVTSTSTVNTINAQVLFASNQNWPIIFLLLFLPCGILLGATRNLSGGMVGLLIGSVICLMAGVIPAYIFTGLLIGIVAMMVLIQRSGPNG